MSAASGPGRGHAGAGRTAGGVATAVVRHERMPTAIAIDSTDSTIQRVGIPDSTRDPRQTGKIAERVAFDPCCRSCEL